MAQLFYDTDAAVARLAGRPVAIIGFGSQGHAHALNLRDSGLDVRVGLHEGSRSRAKAEAAGLRVLPTAVAVDEAQIIMVLTPDTGQGALYRDAIRPHLGAGKTLMFAHGFNIRYEQIVPPVGVDVSMVAPKAPGHRVREVFVEGGGVPALVAVHQDASGHALPTALAYAKALGATRALLADIQSGAFASAWMEENRQGRPEFARQRARDGDHAIERVGRELRRMMPFVNPQEVVPGQ